MQHQTTLWCFDVPAEHRELVVSFTPTDPVNKQGPVWLYGTPPENAQNNSQEKVSKILVKLSRVDAKTHKKYHSIKMHKQLVGLRVTAALPARDRFPELLSPRPIDDSHWRASSDVSEMLLAR